MSQNTGAAANIRAATPADAGAIVAIIEGIASEEVCTAISRPWSVGRQQDHITALSPREAIHVAETSEAGVIGYQTLELWAPTLESMAHVAQIGTFLRFEWRGQGIGEALFRKTVDFAREHEILKFIIQVRSMNLPAQRFYRRLGFRECGRLTRQVRIGRQEDDEILMELFLP